MGPVADLEEVIDAYHRSVAEFVCGDPEGQKRLWSQADDVTLANPLGPPACGWRQVEEAMDRAASLLRDGEVLSVDRVSAYSARDVAWTVEIEHARVKLAGAPEHSPTSLRVTTIFRREDGDWRIVHRHADPITTPRSPESMIQD
jgi:ketosteroid isomerase-like protein